MHTFKTLTINAMSMGMRFAQGIGQQMAKCPGPPVTSVRHFFRDPMSLWLNDPLRPMRSMLRRPFDPFATLDHFLDNRFVPHKIRDNAAKLEFDGKGNLTYTVDTSGYRPEELKVSMEGDEFVIQGEHRQESDDEMVQRQFTRRVRIPAGFQKESVKCELDEKGLLCMTALREGNERGTERRSIPIEVRTTKHTGGGEE